MAQLFQMNGPEDYPDGYSEPTCEICGAYAEWVECPQCGGEGGRDGYELMEEDPMWYGPDDYEACDLCEGKGGWGECTGLPHTDEQVANAKKEEA